MKLCTPFCRTFFLFFFIHAVAPLFSQQELNVSMNGSRMRAPVDVQEGQTTVHLCDLQPGKTYSVIVAGAGYAQQSTFKLTPSAALTQSAPDVQRIRELKHTLRFTATSTCADVLLDATDPQGLTTIPLYVSMSCENCREEGEWLEKFKANVEAANLSVSSNIPVEDLITNVLVGGDCFEVSNITDAGSTAARGVFSNGATNIGISNGIVLSTGVVGQLPGPNNENNSGNITFNVNSPNDPDLATLANGDQWDIAKIEFDFTPTAPMVQFDFVFGSEEYCEYVNSPYNDVFGFFISGPGITGKKNLAVIPNSSTPISVNNINHLNNSAYYINNNNYFNLFQPNCIGIPMAAQTECELDGWTTQFTATANVIPCSTYHIKLIIADMSDYLFSSAVFLRANSFEAGGQARGAAVYPANLNSAYEGCADGFIRISRDSTGIDQPLTVHFTIDSSSTATPVADYEPLVSPVTIPAGATEILIPVQVADDQTPETPETIVLLLDNACTCTQSEVTFFIQDKPALGVTLADQSGCAGAFTLAPVTDGGLPPYSYLWSTGETTPTITVNALGSGFYNVVVTDSCGTAASDTALIQLFPPTTVDTTVSFCSGETVTIGGTVYSAPATVLDTLAGVNGACDTVLTYHLQFLTPAPSTVSLNCPAGLVFTADSPTAINYDPPVAGSDCPCPGVAIELSQGLPSGSLFSPGVTNVCYTATDSCGNSASCCFEVRLVESEPCDIKIIGCIKFELLSITQDDDENTTYRIRVTNSCSNPLVYVAFQLPKGVTALEPANNTQYQAPSGRAYDVRNPNYSPFYSLRFASKDPGISGGASDIFEYTLPPRNITNYIHAMVKLAPQTYHEAHLNTFYCPIGKTPDSGMRTRQNGTEFRSIAAIYPNPTNGTIYADFSAWQGQTVQTQLFDSRGMRVQQLSLNAGEGMLEIRLPAHLPQGLYFLDVQPENGERQITRLMVSY